MAASADAIKIYDSMKNKGIPKEIHLFFENYYDKKLEITVSEGYPQQNNVYDCGIFMLSAIEDLIEGREWTFSQEKMPEIRLEIAKKLMNYGLWNTISLLFKDCLEDNPGLIFSSLYDVDNPLFKSVECLVEV